MAALRSREAGCRVCGGREPDEIKCYGASAWQRRSQTSNRHVCATREKMCVSAIKRLLSSQLISCRNEAHEGRGIFHMNDVEKPKQLAIGERAVG